MAGASSSSASGARNPVINPGHIADCPFDFYEILLNPRDYKVQPGDEALAFATDFANA